MMEAYPEVLSALISSDNVQRKNAEEQLKLLETTPAFSLRLTEIIVGVGHSQPVPTRLMACTLLKNFVNDHWSTTSKTFSLPEVTGETKVRIRKILPIALKDPEKHIRICAAYAIAAISHFDYPQDWPTLFDLVGGALRSNNADLVHGAMHLLQEIVNGVTEQQLKTMEDVLLSELLQVFMQTQVFSLETRTRAVSIFSSITKNVYKIMKSDSTAAHRLGYYYSLYRFVDPMAKALALPDDGQISDMALKTEIVKALGLAVDKFSKQMQKWVPRILPYVGAMLQTSSESYTRIVVNGENDDTGAVDPEGLEQLIYSLIEFIQAVLCETRFGYPQHIVNATSELVYLLLIYIQIPNDKVKEWKKDLQRYVEDEDVDTCNNSVRMSAVELLQQLCESHPKETIVGLCIAVTRYVAESGQRKEAGDANWWRIREACYTAMGSVSWRLLDVLKGKPDGVEFHIREFLMNVLMPDITNPGPVFLQGHAILLGGRIADAWGDSVLEPLLELCSRALLPVNSIIIRISACRAFYNFCVEAKKHPGADLAKLCDMKPVVSSLVTLGIRSSEAVLNLVLSSLITVLQANPEAATTESKAIPLAIAAMLKYSGDPVIPSQVSEIVEAIIKVPACREQVERTMLLTIFSVLRCDDKSKLPIRLPAVCLEILEAIIRGSPRPLSDSMIQNGFPQTVQCLLTSDDAHTLSAGRDCIRAFISKAPEQVINWTDGTNTGVSLIVQIIRHLLSPATPELSASMVGRLIFVLLKRANDAISPYLVEILGAVLCKMQTTQMNSVHQGLIMVFAHLIHYQLEPVLLFLSSVPMPDGSIALSYVLSLWCEKEKNFFGGFFDQKVNTLALCKLFLYALNSPDATLREMTVASEPIAVANESSPPRQQSIPLLVKMFKLFIYELDILLEMNRKRSSEVRIVGDQSAENDEEGENEDQPPTTSRGGDDLTEALRDLVTGMQDEVDGEISDENDDPDVVDDPIARVDLVEELTNFLTQLSRQSYFQEFCQHLDERERAVLHQINLIS